MLLTNTNPRGHEPPFRCFDFHLFALGGRGWGRLTLMAGHARQSCRRAPWFLVFQLKFLTGPFDKVSFTQKNWGKTRPPSQRTKGIVKLTAKLD